MTNRTVERLRARVADWKWVCDEQSRVNDMIRTDRDRWISIAADLYHALRFLPEAESGAGREAIDAYRKACNDRGI